MLAELPCGTWGGDVGDIPGLHREPQRCLPGKQWPLLKRGPCGTRREPSPEASPSPKQSQVDAEACSVPSSHGSAEGPADSRTLQLAWGQVLARPHLQLLMENMFCVLGVLRESRVLWLNQRKCLKTRSSLSVAASMAVSNCVEPVAWSSEPVSPPEDGRQGPERVHRGLVLLPCPGGTGRTRNSQGEWLFWEQEARGALTRDRKYNDDSRTCRTRVCASSLLVVHVSSRVIGTRGDPPSSVCPARLTGLPLGSFFTYVFIDFYHGHRRPPRWVTNTQREAAEVCSHLLL